MFQYYYLEWFILTVYNHVLPIHDGAFWFLPDCNIILNMLGDARAPSGGCTRRLQLLSTKKLGKKKKKKTLGHRVQFYLLRFEVTFYMMLLHLLIDCDLESMWQIISSNRKLV